MDHLAWALPGCQEVHQRGNLAEFELVRKGVRAQFDKGLAREQCALTAATIGLLAELLTGHPVYRLTVKTDDMQYVAHDEAPCRSDGLQVWSSDASSSARGLNP